MTSFQPCNKKVIKKALKESTKTITPETISQIYKDLQTPQLEGLIEQVIEGVTTRVLGEFDNICERYEVNDRLVELDDIIDKKKEEEERNKLAIAKQNGSETSLTNSSNKRKKEGNNNETNYRSLPEGITPADILRYSSYKNRKLERAELLAEIQKLEETNQKLGEQVEVGKSDIEKAVNEVEEVKGEMERVADVCGGR